MLVNKLLWSSNKKSHFTGAFLGSLIGFILLLLCIQLYIDFKNLLTSGENLLQPEYLVINKKVSVFKAVRSNALAFTEEEINKISNEPFVKEVAPFIASTFKVGGYTQQTKNIPAFYTDLFFESVEDKYLDIDKPEWKWDKDAPYVPIIIPKDYLNLYNFGFSDSQGLPKISEGMISLVTFMLRIEGNGKEIDLPAKIIGFSNRINSILVPHTFMKWANETYGSGYRTQPQRLVLVTDDPSDPGIVNFLNQNNYETNSEKLKNSKTMLILKIVASVFGSIALIIVFLSFMNFVLGFQILIFRSADKIRLLLQLGYTYSKIRNLYALYYLAGMLIIIFLSFVSVKIINNIIANYLTSLRITNESAVHLPVILTGIGIIVILFIFNFLTLNSQIIKMGKNK